MAEPPSMDPSMMNPSGVYDSSSGSDGSYPFDTKVEGYDFEFEPPADSRYECAICLFVLREPRQTPCGHRFCKNCILRWIRGSHQPARCPVDNEEILESDLFPDNFARREIQNFNARCPNSKQGCDVITTVKELPAHQNECPLALVPCPNRCSNVLLRRDLEEHVKSACDRRSVQCPDCSNDFIALEFETHVQSCPKGQVKCQLCEEEVTREVLPTHEEDLCPQKIITCTFGVLGCNIKIERCTMEDHLRDSMSDHMVMLCQGLTRIFHFLNMDPLSRDMTTFPSRNLSPTEMSGAMTSMAHHLTSVEAGLSLRSSPVLQGGPLSFPSHMLKTPVPASTSLDSSSRRLHGQSSQLRRSPSDPKYLMSGATSTGTLEAQVLNYASGALSDAEGGNMSGHSLRMDSSSKSSYSTMHDEQKLVLHEQRLLELQAKVDSYKLKMRAQEQQLNEMEGRICNGEFFWKIRNYSKYQREAEKGETTALHSLPFYTSPSGGYKLCVRANLNGVDSARGSHLSLFIHFMQGEYDDVLEWPFGGRIILSVMDQNDCCELRNHVAETLAAKPNLAAFQRPTTPRNHKGFGYMEFLPLSALKNSSYIKNDTLIIKAHVLPSG
ncbi:TNF receptor-associated factor 6-like [Littorina saxatilis]|uniref:TNF receptor-associated factor 6-like n=1 Tax=Littorina saxatilis TaxID=31220 RepID=UPI0038B56289